MKTISDKIFELLKEKGMSQKEFAQRTGIAESSISDWKKKRTNPVSDKILIICEVLDVTPYELLSGAEHTGNRSRDNNTYVISKENAGRNISKIRYKCTEKIDWIFGTTQRTFIKNLPI